MVGVGAMTDPLGTSAFLDALRSSYDHRHAEPDPQDDAEDERYQRETHEPHKPTGGSDSER
jgi:hypothetical protein